MKPTKNMEQYVKDTKEDVLQLLRELAVIPSPSHHEDKRVAYVKDWMEKNGAEGVYVDEAKNVIWPVNVTKDNDLVVFMAHTDVVFPDETPLPLTEDEERMYCPGVGDDTANLSILLYAAKYFHDRKISPKTGILIVANSCEEGLGNLKGSRRIVDDFGSRIKAFYTVESNPSRIIDRAVGSHRYRVTVKTEGGHSYGAFGNRNAIAMLASMITTFYDVKVPQKENTKTTYNVGSIEGGTSVNTICQEASMLFEYRSNDLECLAKMKNIFDKVIEAYRAMEISVEVKLLGERPCGMDLGKAYEEFLEIPEQAAFDTLGIQTDRGSSSTDANYPLSKGIFATCIGGCTGKGCHTREEYINKDSLVDGLRYVLAVMSNYFNI